jgi:hypothetical protein
LAIYLLKANFLSIPQIDVPFAMKGQRPSADWTHRNKRFEFYLLFSKCSEEWVKIEMPLPLYPRFFEDLWMPKYGVFCGVYLSAPRFLARWKRLGSLARALPI